MGLQIRRNFHKLERLPKLFSCVKKIRHSALDSVNNDLRRSRGERSRKLPIWIVLPHGVPRAGQAQPLRNRLGCGSAALLFFYDATTRRGFPQGVFVFSNIPGSFVHF